MRIIQCLTVAAVWGFAVAQVSLHHPTRLAEQMSILDNIGKGRVIVG